MKFLDESLQAYLKQRCVSEQQVELDQKQHRTPRGIQLQKRRRVSDHSGQESQ
jgi:hypothetical protein